MIESVSNHHSGSNTRQNPAVAFVITRCKQRSWGYARHSYHEDTDKMVKYHWLFFRLRASTSPLCKSGHWPMNRLSHDLARCGTPADGDNRQRGCFKKLWKRLSRFGSRHDFHKPIESAVTADPVDKRLTECRIGLENFDQLLGGQIVGRDLLKEAAA